MIRSRRGGGVIVRGAQIRESRGLVGRRGAKRWSLSQVEESEERVRG